MKKSTQILFSALLGLSLIPVAGLFYLNLQADKMLYYKYGKAYWLKANPAQCDDYRKGYFKDLRPGASADSNLDLSCEAALKLTAESRFASNSEGMNIHYRVFPDQTPKSTSKSTTTKASADAPLLLHVSGITSTWLNGARYAKAAERMGFQLISMEMRNHGISDHNQAGVSYGCKEKEDVKAVLSALQKDFPQRPILLWGSSGGSMAILNAAPSLPSQFPQVKALLVESPSSSLRDVAESKSPGLPPWLYETAIGIAGMRAGVKFQDCAATTLAPEVKLPTWVVVNQEDPLTPPWMAKKIHAALPAALRSLTIYPHGGHEAVWNGQPEPYEADLRKFWEQGRL
ncbi:MAG: alpha/beta hydrolase [Candidatus Sericytochromatia bacterium]|nr:alpha/beta hydrolase [Candidatus Sericytochromatia bacterium]